MRSMGEAQHILNKAAQRLFSIPPVVESISLWEGGGRVLAENIISREDFPAFERSRFDGFALPSADTTGASAADPVYFKVVGRIAAGERSLKKLPPGTAMKIFTGAPLPEGADCVIKEEEVVEIIPGSGTDAAVIVKRAVAKNEGTARRGEEIAAGEPLFAGGTVLSFTHLGVLATLGIDPLPVYARPKVGIFSTGNELVDIGSQPASGQLRVSNIHALAQIVRLAGGIPVNLGIVKDRLDSIREVYTKTRQMKLPLVISTGGTATGDYDLTAAAMEQVSARLLNKVAISPGAPFIVSQRENEQLLIGLSGCPGGAEVAMLLLLYPLIARLAGTSKRLECIPAKLTHPLSYEGDVPGFIWAHYYYRDLQVYVTPFENQYCGAIKTHARSNCLIETASGQVNLAAHEMVPVWKLPIPY